MAKKILIVEDDFDTRYVLSLILGNEGFEIFTAADGECALAVASEHKPDLIITDVSMPRMNGIELTRKIRLDQQTAAMPILAITAYGPATMRNAIDAGASVCTRKPIVFAELLPIIQSLIDEGEHSLNVQILGQGRSEPAEEKKKPSRRPTRNSGEDTDKYKAICAAVSHDIKGELIHIADSASVIKEVVGPSPELQEECEIIEGSVVRSEELLQTLRALKDTSDNLIQNIENELSRIGNSESLIREAAGSSPEVQEECDIIKRSILYCMLPLQRLRNFIDKGRLRVEAVDVLDLLRNVETLSNARLPSNIQLRVTVAKGISTAIVMSDKEQLIGTLMELIKNAANALVFTGGTIELKLERKWRRVVISVIDNGPGIPVSIRKKLLKEQVASRSGSGSGLFLYNKVVTKMGGRMVVRDTSEKGTTVSISLPGAK